MPRGIYTRTFKTHNAKTFVAYGKTYASLSDLANAVGISRPTLGEGIRKHPEMAVEDVIEKILANRKGITVDGKTFKNVDEMCANYDISKALYLKRKRQGMSMLDALKTPKEHSNKQLKCVYKGVEYKSAIALAKELNISYTYLRKKICEGLSLEEAVEECQNLHCVKDFKGNEFPSITAMCDHYGIYLARYQKGIKEGWSLEEILVPEKTVYTDPWGHQFSTREEMCDFHGVKMCTFKSRKDQKHKDLFDTLTGFYKDNTPCEIYIKDIVVNYMFGDYFQVIYNKKDYIWSKQQLKEYVLANTDSAKEIRTKRLKKLA